MQYREVAWSQQLHMQRLLHGAGAEVTERSYPNYPGSALREVLRQSGHPHNVEPLLLTLRRPVNTITRKHFAEVAGELVLLEKVTSSKPVVTDLQVAVHGQVVEAADGILYPTKDTNTKYETWLRVEMLDVLRLMIEEGLVKSLVPEMQAKLIEDMLQLASDDEKHELERLYAFCAAYAALKKFHAARPAALKADFLQRAATYLSVVLDEASRPAGSCFIDPFEYLKALTTCVEALYFASINNQQGDYSLAATGAAAGTAARAGASTSLEDLQQQQQHHYHLQPLLDVGAAPLLVQAVQQAWQMLQARDNFTYTPPASEAANGHAAGDSGDDGEKQQDGSSEQEPESEELKELRAEAEAAAARANMTFDENWQAFLKAVYDTELVPTYAVTAIQLGCSLLQLLAHEGVEGQLPSAEVLQQLASYSKEPLLATTGSILLASTGTDTAAGAAADGVDGRIAIIALPLHQQLELTTFAKLCYACCKPEGRGVKMLRCSACGCVTYCCADCQKADWKAGHKGACKQLGESRARLVAA